MGGFDPVYDNDETADLSEKERHILRQAVLQQLNTSAQIRNLLRSKTLPVFKKLKSKKSKTARKRK